MARRAAAMAVSSQVDSTPAARPDLDEGQHDRQHVQRRAPAGPRGARGGPQAPGHVHRLDRHPRPHALPVGDHRQRRRRGAGRRRARGSRSPCTPTTRSRSTTTGAASRSTRSPRPGCPASRSSSPSCTPAASSAAARTSPPAACTASVPRSSTRCRRGSTSTSTARRPSRGMSFQRGVPGVFDGDGPAGARSTAKSGLTRKGKRVAKGTHRHPDPVLAGPADLHQGRHVRVRRAGHPRPADVVHRARPRAGDPRPARRRSPVEEKFRHDGGIAEFAEFLAARRAGHRRAPAAGHATRSPRRCRCSTTRAT